MQVHWHPTFPPFHMLLANSSRLLPHQGLSRHIVARPGVYIHREFRESDELLMTAFHVLFVTVRKSSDC